MVQVIEYNEGCFEEMQWCSDPVNAGQCDDTPCFYWVWREIEVFFGDQSDGVVAAYSARNDGGAWRGHIVESPHTNHRELLVYDRIHDTFDPIFNGTNTGFQQIFTIGR